MAISRQNWMRWMLCSGALLTGGGCQSASEPEPHTTRRPMTFADPPLYAEIPVEERDVWLPPPKFSYEQREDAFIWVSRQIARLEQDQAALEQQLGRLDDADQATLRTRLLRLKERRETLESELATLRDADEEDWSTAWEQVEQASRRGED